MMKLVSVKKLLVVITAFMSAFVANAQNDAEQQLLELLKVIKPKYDISQSYDLDMNYKVYANHKDEQPQEYYKNNMKVDKGRLYTKIGETEMIQLKEVQIKIDHSKKVMAVRPLAKEENRDVLNLEKFVAAFKEVKRTKEGKYTKYILLAPKVSQLPYNRVELYFDESAKTMHKQVLYYFNQVSYMKEGKEQKSTPKIEIVFSALKKVTDLSVFNKGKYITVKNNKISVATAFNQYTIYNNHGQ